MKKFLVMLLTLAMLLALCACANNAATPSTDAPVHGRAGDRRPGARRARR